MRTAIIIGLGLVSWAIFIGVAKFAAPGPTAAKMATRAFVAVWFIAATANLCIGVTRAGYSVRDELPIFLLIFLIPASIAVVMKWKVL